MQKMEVRNDVMAFLGMETEGGEQVESVVHSSLPLYESTYEQPRAIKEEYHNFSNEESSLPIASPVYGGFDEVFSPPLYDKYEDEYLGYEGPRWNVSSCSSNSEL